MKRGVTAPKALLFGLVLYAPSASAIQSDNPNPSMDFMVGAGEFGAAITGERFSVGAIAGPLGEDPRGHLRVTFPDPTFDVDTPVECLVVVDNLAAAGSEVLENAGGAVQRLVLLVEDNGKAGDPLPDRALPVRLSITVENPPAQAFCTAALGLIAGAEPIDHGNVTVHDGQPTSADVLGAAPLPKLGAGTWRVELPDGTVMTVEVP